MASERRRLVSSRRASTSETLKKERQSGEVSGEEGAVLESPAEDMVAPGMRDWVNCLKSCRLRRESGRRKEEEEEDESWEVSEDKDLTRFFIMCLWRTAEEEVGGTPSRGSLSEERDLTKLKKGLSLDGKLKDLVGEEVDFELFFELVGNNDGIRVGELVL